MTHKSIDPRTFSRPRFGSGNPNKGKSHRLGPGTCLSVALLVVSVAPSALAQENTAAACRDGVDNDSDGYTDCADQDCGAIVDCAQVSPHPHVPPSHIRGYGWAGAGAIMGFSQALLSLSLSNAATGFEGSENGLAASIALNTASGVLEIVFVPIVAASARSARRVSGGRGCLGCRIAGWIFYGLTIAYGAALIPLGVASDVDLSVWANASFGMVSTISPVLMSIDALVSRGQARRRVRTGMRDRGFAVAPFAAPLRRDEGVDGVMAGVAVVH